jgi:hypothetical protein
MKTTLNKLERLAKLKGKVSLDIANAIKAARESQCDIERSLADVSEPMKSRLQRAYRRMGINYE